MESEVELVWDKEPYADIIAKDGRYDTRAYDFVIDVVESASAEVKGHISGQELLSYFRDVALDSFGPMAYTVLADWGVTCCEDVGEIVFNLCDTKRLGKQPEDSRADFIGGFDFREEFLGPFKP